MTIEITALVLSICAFLFTLVTAAFSVLAYSKVVGMEKSTHQVQWMPIDDPGSESKLFQNHTREDLSDDGGLAGDGFLKAMATKMYPDIEEEMV